MARLEISAWESEHLSGWSTHSMQFVLLARAQPDDPYTVWEEVWDFTDGVLTSHRHYGRLT